MKNNIPEIFITIGVFLFAYSFIGEPLFKYVSFEPIIQKAIILGARLVGTVCITLGFILHNKRGKKDD